MAVFLITEASTYGQQPSSAPAKLTAEQRKERIRQLAEIAVARSRPLVVYGRVLDQFGEGVENAELLIYVRLWVSVSEERAGMDVRPIRLKTSANGEFRMNGELSGESLVISDVRKEGYEWQRGLSWLGTSDLINKPPDPAKPVIIRVRKRQPGTFLIEFVGGDELVSSDPSTGKDLYGYLGYRIVRLSPEPDFPKGFYSDFKYAASLMPSGDSWQVTFTSDGATGGVQLLEEKLYTAPENGYQASVSINVPVADGGIGPKYLYVKSRDPSLYARLEYVFEAWRDRIRFHVDGVSNPYGDRNLEMDPRIIEVSGLGPELANQAGRIFRKGTRPAIPDLPKLISEGLAANARKMGKRKAAIAAATQPQVRSRPK